jgi:hypothetical protein
VRAVAARAPSLDLALLRSYRVLRGKDDGLFLRYGALDETTLCKAALDLVAAERRA